MSQTPRVGSTAFTSGYGGPKGLSHSIIHWTTSGSLIGSPDQNSVTSALTRLKSTLHIPPPQAKGRSPIALEAPTLSENPVRRTRGSCSNAWERAVHAPPGIVMVAPPRLLRNAEVA